MSLSAHRSEEAECGTAHITARKLGALFGDVIIPAPNLFRAYGLRASEIAKSTKFNPKGTKRDGIFADQIGADGTTIWAAATSGHAAIAVHLLACMLARIWPGPEATSIWVELVTERKRALSTPNDRDSFNLSSITAAQICLTREQLAKWDASARAWLLTADEAKEISQKQLMLIVNNIGIPVNVKSTTYESVMQAWNTAMSTMDNLVAGLPQSVHIGAPLLGLSSWHLYPDMLVLGNTTKDVKQNDVLIAPGSLITVGLQDTKSGIDGVYWSLPLAHLRFYGDPVSLTSSTGSNTSRVSIEQLLQVALGTLLDSWITTAADFDLAAEVLVLMWDNIAHGNHNEELQTSWPSVLADAARVFIGSTGVERTESLQLMRSGRRRYASFLAERKDCPPPFLGLSICTAFLGVLRRDEDRIWMLREVASGFAGNAENMVIQYKHTTFAFGHSSFECATVTPSKVRHCGYERSSEGPSFVTNGHIRWIESGALPGARIRPKHLLSTGEDIVLLQSGSVIPCFQSGPGFCWVNVPSMFSEHFSSCDRTKSIQLQFLFGDPQVAAVYSIQTENISTINVVTLQHVKQAFARGFVSSGAFQEHLSNLANYTKSTGESLIPPIRKRPRAASKVRQDEDEVFEPFTANDIDRMLKTDRFPKSRSGRFMQSLRALATVVEVYKSLPKASVALRIASRPLHQSKWVPVLYSHLYGPKLPLGDLQPHVLSRAQTFACIAMFESGSFNLDPDTLAPVMAMSSGNSIYVAAPLLSDPWKKAQARKIERVIGNVGRPGIAMMIPPENPRTRVLEHDTWNCINHSEFDGTPEDCFQHTTLHLSFSDWEMPLDVGTHGVRDTEVFFLEAPISIHDRGKWVADLDILSMFSDSKFSRVDISPCSCAHGTSDAVHMSSDMACIDNWEELLESPVETGVVRAHANWQARLAAAALSVQRGHYTRVLPEHVCCGCFAQRGIGIVRPNETESSYGDDEEFRESRCDEDDRSDEDGGSDEDDDEDDNDGYYSGDQVDTKHNEQGDSGTHITPKVIYIM
ncbi:MAG: hypothetical protein M1830_007263 [Pleopsidium flavum]|nr:MAG: hypothetical protein M1830_007263 [Pleopsidium flavum]